ncbi:MAG: diaminopimelate epimerase [Acidobacteriota bacterium]|jgi:diaminopimelate epimerase|nr:diaminopimelate epimerase [Acidobacteriota bacterium]
MTGFFKVSGSGNDFLALVEEPEPAPEAIQAWCRRGISLGADGLFVLRRSADGVAMDYFNSDGYPADLCLNGTRCAAQLAFHLRWAEDTVAIRTGAGTVAARRGDETRVTLELPAPEPPRELILDVDGIRCAGYGVRVGVPHFVLPWPESLDQAPVDTLGRQIRHHPLFPEGANVNFVRYPDGHRMEIRTFERGVEAETLSCGSGILAGAAVGLHIGRSALPLRVSVQGGFELEVGSIAGIGSAWLLSGDARVVAQGVLLEGAAVSPPSPTWS